MWKKWINILWYQNSGDAEKSTIINIFEYCHTSARAALQSTIQRGHKQKQVTVLTIFSETPLWPEMSNSRPMGHIWPMRQLYPACKIILYTYISELASPYVAGTPSILQIPNCTVISSCSSCHFGWTNTSPPKMPQKNVYSENTSFQDRCGQSICSMHGTTMEEPYTTKYSVVIH